MNSETESPSQRLETIRSRITDACNRYQRPKDSVVLVAVAKTHPAQKIRDLYQAGQRVFAENYVQEGVNKTRELAELGIEWHFIGRIQGNKCADVAANFGWIHSVDRLRIARRLAENAAEGTKLNIMIQVNIDNEESKSGVLVDELPELVAQIRQLDRICLRGLMAIPRAEKDFERQRHAFSRLRELRDRLNDDGANLDSLSMGMSNDLEAAIAEGATHVRVGTALFGPRNYTT